ncbi:MAG: hypothetical protein R3F30_13995 [Planctomycetota bacterium]
MTPCTLVILAALPALQAPPPPPPAPETERSPLERFRALPEALRRDLVERLEKRIRLDSDPVVQRIVSIGPAAGSLPLAEPVPYHRARDWARGVAPERELVPEGTPAHAAVRRRVPERTFLPRLAKAVTYDWRTGRLVRRKEPLSPEERFTNLLAGFPPNADLAAAWLLKLYDQDKEQRKLGEYFAHGYADLDAKVYAGVTLYEAWYSGRMIDVPDVDAIPFERNVLGTKHFRSPIPADRRRDALYQRIKEAALAHRKYRTLREALAAAWIAADPGLEDVYDLLVPRFHYLYARKGHDPEAVAAFVKGFDDRDAIIEALDAELGTDRKAQDARRKQYDLMAQLRRKLRDGAMSFLEAYEQKAAEDR